jgi:hypothetical protein
MRERSRLARAVPVRTVSVRAVLVRAVLVASGLALTACGQQSDISFVVIVKSSNYAQDVDGRLTLLNYHFFSEIFLKEGGSLMSATLTRSAAPDDRVAYESRGDNFYVEGGHFESQEAVDRAYPNGSYVVNVETPSLALTDFELDLAGPEGRTDIPAPITVTLWQEEVSVPPLFVDPDEDLLVRWSAYSNGAEDPRGIVDDMIFLVIADCQGERIFHTGLPFQGDYTTFRTNQMLIPSGALHAGQPYSAFVEFPHVVDSRVEQGVPGFSSYATATYLDLRTSGEKADQTCPDSPPPMDTGQTDRMDEADGRTGRR